MQIVQLNKYLKEIGIDENYWLFKEKGDDYKPDKDGFIMAEYYNLDTSYAIMMYSTLCYFRDNCLKGYPASMSFEKWQEKIDIMIEAFKLIITKDVFDLSKKERKKIKFGLRQFSKYFFDLWW